VHRISSSFRLQLDLVDSASSWLEERGENNLRLAGEKREECIGYPHLSASASD
jgi:hypothetical protein